MQSFDKAWSAAPSITRVSCSFSPNDTSPPTVNSRVGVVDITRTGVGTFRIDLLEKHVSLESFSVSILQNIKFIGSYIAFLASEDVVSNKTVVVTTASDATGNAIDVSAIDQVTISVDLYLSVTTAT